MSPSLNYAHVLSILHVLYRQSFGEISQSNSPTCNASNIATFDWDELLSSGIGRPQEVEFNLDVDETDLSLNILAKLTYEGRSSADNKGAVYGTTYVLDFEDFDAYSDDIRLPGTCQNRNAADFAGDFPSFSDYWDYSINPSENASVGTRNTLAYPPANPEVGSWTVYMDADTDVCGVVVYEGKFTWNDLVGCTSNDGSVSYVTTTQTDGDDPTISLSGSFYINVVSPFDFAEDAGYYRVYQVLSQPFVITIHRMVYVLDAAGVNVLTISIIAVSKENGASEFKLAILTEAQEYLQLTRTDTSLYLFASNGTESSSITTGEFTVAQTAETSESSPNDGCLDNNAFICSQLWQISAPGDCSNDGEQYIDFSGDYTLEFVPQCRATDDIGDELVTYCQAWLAEHADIAEKVHLTATLTWRDEECDPLLYEVQFEAVMNFYVDQDYSVTAGDDQLYQVGEDRIYTEVVTAFPTDSYNVFDTSLLNVWICTFDPLEPPAEIDPNDPDSWTTAGCLSSSRDGYDLYEKNAYSFHIYSSTDSNGVEANGFELFNDDGHPDASANVLRFSFIPPETIARDKLYVHAQVEVSLQSESGRRRRRRLMDFHRVNQMSHFLEYIGVTVEKRPDSFAYDNNKNEPPQPDTYQQPETRVTPIADYALSLQWSWIMAIGGLVAVILTLNIAFLCYKNFCQHGDGARLQGGRVSFSRARRSGYNSVKPNDSEVDESEVAAINVD